jgi:hypothetical protein
VVTVVVVQALVQAAVAVAVAAQAVVRKLVVTVALAVLAVQVALKVFKVVILILVHRQALETVLSYLHLAAAEAVEHLVHQVMVPLQLLVLAEPLEEQALEQVAVGNDKQIQVTQVLQAVQVLLILVLEAVVVAVQLCMPLVYIPLLVALVALAVLALFIYTTNMWAILNNNNQVIGCAVGISYETALEENKENTLIEMTPENSPATVGDYYDGKNFYKKEN